MGKSLESMGAHFSAFLRNRSNPLPSDLGYESARSCLHVLLKKLQPKRLFIPNYICDAVPAAAEAAGVRVVRYSIDVGFKPAELLFPASDELVLVVNYFGLCNDAVKKLIGSLPMERIIIDCSQAYFFTDNQPTNKIYSPRKFLPVADGGFVKTSALLDSSPCDDHASVRRYQYLLERTFGEPEFSREAYLQAEKDLESISDRRLSSFTRAICETIDIDFIRTRRRENFRILQKLDSVNSMVFEFDEQVPLCYPLMRTNGNKIRERLLQMRIYTPKYWQNIVPVNDFEKSLLECTVFLPVDHRYTTQQMNLLVNIVSDMI